MRTMKALEEGNAVLLSESSNYTTFFRNSYFLLRNFEYRCYVKGVRCWGFFG